MNDLLREGEAFLSEIAKLAPIAIYVYDLAADKLVYANSTYQEITGYSLEEAERLGAELLLRLYHPDDRSRWLQSDHMLAHDREGQVSEGEFRIINKQGVLYWMSIKERVIERDGEGKPLLILGVAMDITKRKQIDQAIKENELRYRQLANSITDIFFAMDENLHYTFWNRASEELTGISAENAIGRSIDEVFPDTTQNSIKQFYLDVLATQQPKTGEITFSIGNKLRYFEIHAYPSIGGISVFTRDITERKLAQEREFEIALEQERVRLLSTFVQNASHELRTPLSTISVSLHLMRRAASDQLRDEYAGRAEQQIMRLTRLLSMILSMTKLDSSNNSFRLHQLDINAVIRDVCAGFQPMMEEHQLQCNLQLAEVLPAINGDAEWLHEALDQVIENAVRFTPVGGSIELCTHEEHGSIIIDIADNGIGIPEESLSHVTERFWRLDTAHSTPGFGLGLPIAQRIIERHRGTLQIQSEIGKGTHVKIILPT